MPGTITFRPIEANLTHNTELLGKMSPYCAFIVGDSVFRGQVCKKGGKHPQWDDSITVPASGLSEVRVDLMDKDRFTKDDTIGSFFINLNELQGGGNSSRWYPLTYKEKSAGEILMETSFSEGFGQSGFGQGGLLNEQTDLLAGNQPLLQEGQFEQERLTTFDNRQTYTEQQQVIEPRTFLKEVDVVETRATAQNIEVLEPQRVLKEVQYTEAVPVTKQIEVCEPVVVKKEVEVIEPRLVTKQIQVVENVTVMKEIEVIESIPRIQEVTTFEPQTFTKQVEVTDYVPVQKQVFVSEPVHVKKAVEFIEPVITTKTITKEVQQPVIVDEKITTTVGPASLVKQTEAQFSSFGLNEEQRLFREREFERLRLSGQSDAEIERQLESQGYGPLGYGQQDSGYIQQKL